MSKDKQQTGLARVALQLGDSADFWKDHKTGVITLGHVCAVTTSEIWFLDLP